MILPSIFGAMVVGDLGYAPDSQSLNCSCCVRMAKVSFVAVFTMLCDICGLSVVIINQNLLYLALIAL